MAESNDPLSERELEILRLVATGAANKEIARQLSISPNTVKVHLRNIFTKIGVFSRTEATLYAVRIGLVQPNAVHEAEESANTEANAPVFASANSETQPERILSDTENAASIINNGLPGIVIEETGNGGLASSQGHASAVARWSPRPWQVALVLVLALILVSAGMLGSRMLAVASPTPKVEPASIILPATPTDTPRWAHRADLPGSRKGMGLVEYENGFILVGGETSQGVDAALLYYDPLKNTWENLAPKPTAVTEIQAVVLGEKVYVPGGLQQNGQATNRLEVYDPRQNIWESKAALPTPLSGYALVAYEGDLYLFGGKNGAQYSQEVYHYDPQQDRWDQRTPMSAPRAYAAAATVNGKIYVMGGYDGQQALARNEAYFPSRDIKEETPWESLPPLPQARYGMGVATLANMIYLLGGYDNSHALASPNGMQYLAQQGTWSEMDTPPAPVGAFSALVGSGNFLYSFGGETPQGISQNSFAYQAIYTLAVPMLNKDSK